MSGSTPVILDDMQASVDRLSDLGKAVVGPIANSIRMSVLLFAAAHNWRVVGHASFSAWVEAQIVGARSVRWLVLDPLFISHSSADACQGVRLTRTATPSGWQITSGLSAEVSCAVQGAEVGLVDDVAASGLTCRHVCDLVASAGGRVSRIILCTSSDDARSSVVQGRDLHWLTFLAGDSDAVHLRDACPCLPFAGRRVWDAPAIETESGCVNVAVPVTAFR